MRTLIPQVQPDHIKSLIVPSRPLHAVMEMIWNSLDAEADHVVVEIGRSELDAVERVVVVDNGHGMTPEECVSEFERVGGSWKAQRRHTRSGTRVVHGSKGRGRYRAFALGRRVRWTTVAEVGGRRLRSVITGTEDAPGNFSVTELEDAQEVDEPTGTRFEADPAHDEGLGELLHEGASHELTKQFAPYLRQYPSVRIEYDGRMLDPESLIERRHNAVISAEDDEGHLLEADMEIVEWGRKIVASVLLCNKDGFALGEVPAGVRQRGFAFTAYLSSEVFGEIGVATLDSTPDFHPKVSPLLHAAKDEIRDYLEHRASEQSKELVKEWKKSDIYPYVGPPKSVIEQSEREVFDAVTAEVNEHLPSFRSQSDKEKKLALHLLQRTLESGPTELVDLLDNVLDLPVESREQLRELLRRASLESLIKASRVVIERIDFLGALERIVFNEELRQEVTERGQLHELIAENAWIFGEQYHLAISERGLTEVLRKHADQRGLEVSIAGEPVEIAEGRGGRVDLMLSAQIGMGEEIENLVVELKRPSQILTSREIDQVRDYAIAVAKDERFAHPDTRWEFWLVGTDLDDNAKTQARQPNRPAGLIGEYHNTRLWAKTWAEAIRVCKHSLDFYRRELGITYDGDEGIEFLKRRYPDYLPPSLHEA